MRLRYARYFCTGESEPILLRSGRVQASGASIKLTDTWELCAMFDESSQWTIVLPEECLGYGLVVPFLACRFALWFRIMK